MAISASESVKTGFSISDLRNGLVHSMGLTNYTSRLGMVHLSQHRSAANNKEVSRTPSQALTKVISASISYRGRWCRPCIYEIAAKGMGMLSKDEGGLAVHAC